MRNVGIGMMISVFSHTISDNGRASDVGRPITVDFVGDGAAGMGSNLLVDFPGGGVAGLLKGSLVDDVVHVVDRGTVVDGDGASIGFVGGGGCGDVRVVHFLDDISPPAGPK